MERLTRHAADPVERASLPLLQVGQVGPLDQFAGPQAATSQRGMEDPVRHAAGRVELGFLQLPLSLLGLNLMGVRCAQPLDVASQHTTEVLERSVAGLVVPVEGQRSAGVFQPREAWGLGVPGSGGLEPLGPRAMGPRGPHCAADKLPLSEILKACD